MSAILDTDDSDVKAGGVPHALKLVPARGGRKRVKGHGRGDRKQGEV